MANSSCSQHKRELAGISDMKVLAEMIGDLHYETLCELLKELSIKIKRDGVNDIDNKRLELGGALICVSSKLEDAYWYAASAWQISKPFMNENSNQHGKQ